jgi:HlyD family secretion protein
MRNVILGVILTLFIFLSIWLFSYFYSNNVEGSEVYEITTPYLSDITLKSVATGAIRPRREIIITSQMSGIIDELLVEGGDMVKKGDPIARIKLVPSPTALNTAKANVELARLKATEIRRQLLQQRKIHNNDLDVQQAQTNYDNAKIEEEKYQQLFKDGVVPELEYNQYKRSLELAKTELDNARILGNSNIKELQSNLDIAEQELEAAQSNLQLLQKGVASKSGQVANIVRSTVNGMVLNVGVEEGATVIERSNFGQGSIIAEVANMNDLMFLGNIDESDVGKLKNGMKLELTVGAIEKERFAAILDYIAPKGVEETGSVKFTIKASVIQREDIFLRAGYSASADIILDKRKQVLSILERDLKFEDNTDQPYVELETAPSTFEKRLVKVGLSDGINIEILEGLTKEDKIKVQGAAM